MRGRELLTRVGITLVVFGLLVGALAASRYRFDFRVIWAYRGLYLEGMLKTLAVTVVAYVVGLVLGVGVALARLSPRLWIRHLADLYVELIRGTPVLVQIMIAWYGIAPLFGVENKFVVGALALGVFAAAYIGEIFRAGIESVERGQFEAARSLGLTRGRTLRYVVFPQAFKRMIPPLTSELMALTKESSLLFIIGYMELLFTARQAGVTTYRQFEAFLVVAAFYLSITIPLSLLARRLERRFGRSSPLRGAHL